MPADPADGLKTYLQENWQPSSPGRTTDVPDVVRDSNGDPTTDPAQGTGVLIIHGQEDLRASTGTHDIIEVKYVDTIQDRRGKDSEEVIDVLQVHIRISDRDIDDDGLRESVRPRMLGERDANNDSDTLGGLRGEVKRLLNDITKGWKEYDEVDFDIDIRYIKNTDALVVFNVEPRIIERDRQRPL